MEDKANEEGGFNSNSALPRTHLFCRASYDLTFFLLHRTTHVKSLFAFRARNSLFIPFLIRYGRLFRRSRDGQPDPHGPQITKLDFQNQVKYKRASNAGNTRYRHNGGRNNTLEEGTISRGTWVQPSAFPSRKVDDSGGIRCPQAPNFRALDVVKKFYLPHCLRGSASDPSQPANHYVL